MYTSLCFMCFLSVIATITADVVFNVISEGNSVTCEQSKETPAEAIVLEATKLNLSSRYIIGDKPVIANQFQCKDMAGSKVFVESPKNSGNSVESKTVTPSMAGKWKCTILTNQGVGTIIPTVVAKVKGKPYNFTAIYCFVKVHVRLLVTPQMIIFNNMILPTNRIENDEGVIDHYIEYSYIDGTFAHVSCIPRNVEDEKYKYYLEYSLAKDLEEEFKEEIKKPIQLGYGFRTKLTARHHNSEMICTSTWPNDIATVKVTFKLSKKLINRGYIKTNGLISYPINKNRQSYEVNYLFLENQQVNLDCNTYSSEMKYCNGGKLFPKQSRSPFTETCNICNNENKIIETITIKSNILSKKYKETIRLEAVLPENNTFLEVFTYNGTYERNSWVHYEFDQGDEVDLKCLKSTETSTSLVVTYKYNDVGIKNAVSNKIMSSEDDKTVFECEVKEEYDRNSLFITIYKRIQVLLRKRKVWSTSTSTTTDISLFQDADETERPSGETNNYSMPSNGSDIPLWMIILGAVLVCIVLICVLTAMYKMMKRKQKGNASNDYANLQNQNSQASIPDYPQQWSNIEPNYNVPADVRNDSNIYAEPVRGPDDPYAVPIQKSQRVIQKIDDQGPTYAELNLPRSDKTQYVNSIEPQYSSVKELYSQVLPKAMRKANNYGNIFPNSPYVNSDGTEYVEPTYCQAFKK